MPVAVDLGYGWTKALAGERQFLEPSVVGASTTVVEGIGVPKEIRFWDPDGQEYFIGRMAVQQSHVPWHSLGDDKPGNPNTTRLLKTALACVAPYPNGPWVVDYLVTGLPLQLWATQKAEMERILSNLNGTEIRVQRDGKNLHLSVMVKGYYTMVQPMGSFMDLILDDQGSVVRNDVVKGRTLVIDVGFHTVDFLAMAGVEPLSPLCTGANYGLATALKETIRKLNKPACVVDLRMVDGQIGLPEQPLQTLARNVEATVESMNERFDLYLVTGGGGQRVHPHLRLPGRVELKADPQLANVRGYLKVGERLRRKAPVE